MPVGLDLARARQEQGLSREQLAKRAKLSVQWLTAIEEVDVDRLPDMLQLRSCVSAFAAEVGLDPDLTSERYMAQLKHRSALDEFASEEAAGLDVICATTDDAAAAFLVDSPDEFPTEGVPAADVGENADRLEWQPERETRKVALPLWVVWARPASLTYGALAVVTLITLTTGVWFLASLQGPAADLALDTPAPQQATTSHVSERHEKANPQLDSRQTGDLTGLWVLTSQVESSNKNLFKDLTLGFRLQLDQTGNRVRGQGLKWTENGRRIASRARTPITIEGKIEDGRLVLAFTERGTRRTSQGTLKLQRADDGSLHGRFSTDAAQSSGRAQAVRLTSQP
ncbi:MAG TPA: helix-turn-helix transcriptional regulator [Vicinamibacterales bacterium]|nr:helix-turn-helix transcriptional regulator [Vicinamibacterales bacterium]